MLDNILEDKFLVNPIKKQDNIYYFGNSEDADCFDSNHVKSWLDGVFERRWNDKRYINNSVSKYMIENIISQELPVIDIACGPGMGLIPAIMSMRNDTVCIANDASELVLNAWNEYVSKNEKTSNITFLQFSLLNNPLKNDSVDIYTSNLGIGSTRYGEEGYSKVLSELYRTLKPGGMIYTIEGEWIDKTAFLKLFEKMNQQPWDIFVKEGRSWNERFENAGFEIIYDELFEMHYMTDPDDFELAEAANRFGIKIGMEYHGYILKKIV